MVFGVYIFVWADCGLERKFETEPIGTCALPVNYKELELRMVSSNDRHAQKYGGFYLSIDTKILNENFALIQTGFSKEKYE